METISPIEIPTIFVNGEAQPNDVVQDGLTVTNQPVMEVNGPVNLTFSGPEGSTIRFTLGGDNPTLGSKVWEDGQPIIVSSNGNGFDSDTTVVKAKSFLNGRSSTVAKLELRIL